MQKIVPIPEISIIPGDTTALVQVETTPSFSGTQMSQRTMKWMRRGVYTRAVVTYDNLSSSQQLDPRYWGIVVEIHPERENGLEIWWVKNCQVTHSTGEELKIIYSGCSANDLEIQLNYKGP